MCGRYTLTADRFRIKTSFSVDLIDDTPWEPRYNVAPSQEVPVIILENGKRKLVPMKWGLIPYWAKDASIGYKTINARAESVSTKPVFRDSFRKRRCLVPADGFYEWKKLGKAKQPLRIVLKSGELFAFAGLWDTWKSPCGPLRSFTILTTESAGKVHEVHDRMPLILPREAEDLWLDPAVHDARALEPLLRPFPAGQLELYPVSTIVNSPRNDSPECISETPELTRTG